MLQAAHSNHQIGAFENFHQLVEDMLIVLRPGPKVFFQYELRFVNRLKRQLLISHFLFLPIKEMPSEPGKRGNKSSHLLGDIPAFFGLSDQFLFQCGASAPDRDGSWFHPLPKFLGIFEWPPRLNWRVCEIRCWRRLSEVGRFSLINTVRDVPLREGTVRNAGIEQVKAALRTAGFPDTQAPLRFIVMALKLRIK